MNRLQKLSHLRPAAAAGLFSALSIVTVLTVSSLIGLDPAGVSAANEKAPVAPPRVVTPGVGSKPPSDAIVLFDGTDLDEFTRSDGSPATWKIEDGVATIQPRSGAIHTKRKFGDIQLHLEFRTPEGKGRGEGKGNSGIKFHEAYEIQILDNFENASSPMGQCASVYKQHKPYVNACRPPGEWQTYDIIFRAPYFDDSGELVQFGSFTVIHNGVVVQENSELWDERTNSNKPVSREYKQPFFLQDHGNAVSFRNIWVRELERKAPRSEWKQPGWKKSRRK